MDHINVTLFKKKDEQEWKIDYFVRLCDGIFVPYA
jgi:hypothetical protein